MSFFYYSDIFIKAFIIHLVILTLNNNFHNRINLNRKVYVFAVSKNKILYLFTDPKIIIIIIIIHKKRG